MIWKFKEEMKQQLFAMVYVIKESDQDRKNAIAKQLIERGI